MNAPSDLQQRVTDTVANVFDTMVQLAAQPAPAPLPDADVERVTGSVGIAGEQVSGAVYLHLPEPLARQAAGSMLGLRGLAPADSPAVADVIGELTNMVAGGLKGALNDAGAECGMSTPGVMRGRHYVIATEPGVSRSTYGFVCEGQPFSVEVHLRFN